MIRSLILCVTVALVSVFSVGCATTAKQTETFLKTPPAGLPRTAVVAGVPFVEQASKQCGPATLAMATAWAGRAIPVDEIKKQAYTPGANGSYQSDMISAARRNGFLAIPVHGLPSLITEVAAGHPVIIFENLAFNWYPMYHYAIVYGYDLDRETVIMHSGPVKEKHWDMRKFERSWMLEDYWALVVLPPGLLAASADDLAHTSAASNLEQLGFKPEAEKIYRSVLARWPESLSALVAMANISYARGDAKAAAGYLKTATAAHPESAAAWHNLAIAQDDLHQTRDARVSAAKAMSLASEKDRPDYARSLKSLL